jgi:hypothetical protein
VRNDEQRLWAGICGDFDHTMAQAKGYWLADEFHALLDRTRRTGASVWEWKELLDELDERVLSATDHAGRNGDGRVSGARSRLAPVAKAAPTGFGCPKGLCDRQAAVGLLDATPRCHLFDREMSQPA